MGLIKGMRGVASRARVDKIEKEISPILMEGEEIHRAYKYIRDYFVFTSKRLVFVKKQDATGKKIRFHSVAYNKIVHFYIETAGHLKFENQLNLQVAGFSDPVTWTFGRDVDIYELQVAVAKYVL